MRGPKAGRGILIDAEPQRVGHQSAEATVETMEAQLVLILSGAYVGYLPVHFAEPWLRDGALHALCNEALGYHSTFHALTRQGSAENPLLRRFLALLGIRAEGAAARIA